MPEWLTIVIRALGTLVFLFVLTRILGKKQISQLTFFEYVIGITLGDLAGNISTEVESNYWHGVIAILVWCLVPLLLEILTLKSKTLRIWFEGRGRVMIKDGKILEDNLKKERYTADELLEQLRTKSIFRVADVEFALLEPSGDLSVLLKSENQPLTPKHLGMKLVTEKPTQAVMVDGVVQNEPLAAAGRGPGWLQTELEKLGVIKENVFLGQVNTHGELTVDLYDDKLKVPEPSERPALLATLKKCEADLELYSLTTQNEEAKMMYEACSVQLTKAIQQVHTLLRM
ncbi:hypothetical protein A8709_16625 [Paenibacillus pectinilyticus]|uniref:DUF421 domain-containing protein n=1 Tax=Paenibacillus pectinilyticus TaxID=512399 RepID=A0A1C1A542_9BACL|nr:DUF421 domain-containing protein [Paenibacillus pectinilyticus]OCT15681.1 hypothetical protein A8709_16625 [Paenibacillus pectinilyticus]